MTLRTALSVGLCAIPLAACSVASEDARGVDRSETLLSVSASGEAEARPDIAYFRAGVENFGSTGKAASEANREDIAKLNAALAEAGVAPDDIQTQAVNIRRIGYGDRRGQYEARNVVAVTVRDLDQADAAVTAASTAGANIMSGPDLRISDAEAAANTAYTNAYKAARSRAEAYADAANMEIARTLTIRDAGGMQGGQFLAGAMPPPPVSAMPRPQEFAETAVDQSIIQPGQTRSRVTVQVDFALTPK